MTIESYRDDHTKGMFYLIANKVSTAKSKDVKFYVVVEVRLYFQYFLYILYPNSAKSL